MPKSDTWFKPGQSGNPAGRRPGRESARDAVRRELLKQDANGVRRIDAWAVKLVAEAQTSNQILDLLKWLEGGQPSADNLAMERAGAMLDELEEAVRNRKPGAQSA